jgi:glutamyl-tRNA synthetase
MVAAFDVAAVSANTARFDPKKAEAVNSAHVRMLAPDDFARRLEPYVVAELAGRPPVLTDTLDPARRALLVAAAPLVQERSAVLADAAAMLRFLFVDDGAGPGAFAVDADAADRNLGADAVPTLEAALTGLDKVGEWSAPEIEAVLRAALVDGLGLKPRKAFGPVRVAVTGRTVSPPLFESLELLGRERTLARLRAGVERSRSVG